MIKVAKFGGSSVANAEQFRKVKQIVLSDPSRKFIVSSACGKSSSEDHKVTDLLYLCEAHVRFGVSYESIFSQIEEKYYGIKKELGLQIDLEKEFASIRSYMKKGMSTDYLVSRGEYLTSKCLAEYLGYEFVDAADVIAFRYNGDIDLQRTGQLLEERSDGQGMVIPGFYGSLPNGTIKVMSRGGSDITGSVIANVMNALREMSYMGANVLHDDAVFPVKSKNIPINIRNTNAPDDPGTMILNDCSELDRTDPPHAITGITGRKDYTSITIVKNHASAEVGFLRRMLQAFEDYHVSIEEVPTTVDTFSVLVSSSAVQNCLYDIVGRLKEELHPEDVRIEEHLALVAVVGRAMKEQPGMSGRLLSEFGHNKINIKTISQSSDELCIVVGVMNRDFEKAIRCIYRRFISEERTR